MSALIPYLMQANKPRKKAAQELGLLSYAPGGIGTAAQLSKDMLEQGLTTGLLSNVANVGTPMVVQALLGKAAGGPIRDLMVYHGTRATKDWMDDPKWKAKAEAGEDIPAGVASSTFAIDKPKGFLGGLKIMDGLGPHVGTAEAANQRLAKNQNLPAKVFDMPVLSGSTAANNRIRSMNEAYVMPFDIEPQKPFVGKNGKPYTESQLQSKLSDIAESLGFSRSDTRVYSSAYAGSPKLKAIQRAVKEKLVADGYDAIPYINSHEDRGSVSWVLLNDGLLSSPWKVK